MTNSIPGPGLWLLRGRGQRVSAVPRVLPRLVPGGRGGDGQVELHLPKPDNIRSGEDRGALQDPRVM